MFAGTFVFMMAAALWFLRFALSTGWLVAIATLGLPLYTAVSTLVNKMMLGPIAITVCVIVAGYHVLRGHPGRGWAMIGTAIVFTVLLATVFSDPIGDLYSDHGLLALGRGTGLEIAQAAIGSPLAAGASLDAKLDALMSHVVTAGVRQPLQVLNFGIVVDAIGGCRQAWSTAIVSSQGVNGSGPAHAMATCGAPQALAYAQRLGGSDATIGLALLAVAVVVGFFFWYVGLSVMLVGVKSLYFGILVGPAFLIGMMGFGRAQAFAKHCGVELFMHVIQLMVFEVYLAVSAIGLTWVLTTDVLGASTAAAIPRVLIMAVAAAVLWLGFRFADRCFHTDGMGTIGRQVSGAWHAGTGAVRDEAHSYRDKARGVSERIPRRGGDTANTSEQDGAAAARRAPGMEWFKPRSSSSARAQHIAPSSTTVNGTAAQSTAKTAAKSAATTAALTAVKVAAPEVAAPVAAATKAAATAGHVLKSPKSSGSPSLGSRGQGAGGDSSPPLPRPPRTDAASSTAAREPAQAATMASRNSGQQSRPKSATAQPLRATTTPAGTIDNDGSSPSDNPPPRTARPARPPRQIGS